MSGCRILYLSGMKVILRGQGHWKIYFIGFLGPADRCLKRPRLAVFRARCLKAGPKYMQILVSRSQREDKCTWLAAMQDKVCALKKCLLLLRKGMCNSREETNGK